jgi:uncharacterized protein (TIGR04222 family)
MNEFELVGTQFLPFYMIVMLATTSGALITRAALKNVIGQYSDLDMSAYDAAYLTGGDKRVVDAAVAKLLVSEVLTATALPPAIRVTGVMPGNADPVEHSVFQAITLHTISNVRDIYGHVSPISQRIRPKLIEAGLILSAERTAAIRTICTLLTLTPVVFWGLPKILLGLSRHKPVTFLVILCAIGLGTAVWFFCQQCIRTSRGDDAVEYLKGQNRSLEYSLTHGSPGTGTEVALALGLFGTAILLTSPLFATMRPVFCTPSNTSSGFGSGGCGSGSSCGAKREALTPGIYCRFNVLKKI